MRDRFSDENLPDFADTWDTIGIIIDHLGRTTGALIEFGTRADVGGRRWYAALVNLTGEALQEHLHLAEDDAFPDGAAGGAYRMNGRYDVYRPGD